MKFLIQHYASEHANFIVETDRDEDFVAAAEQAIDELGYAIICDGIYVDENSCSQAYFKLLHVDKSQATLMGATDYGWALEEALAHLGYYTPMYLKTCQIYSVAGKRHEKFGAYL